MKKQTKQQLIKQMLKQIRIIINYKMFLFMLRRIKIFNTEKSVKI